MVMTAGYAPEVVDAAVAQMAGSYRMRTRLHLLDLDHNFLADLSDLRVADGSVMVQADQPITRSVSLQLVDRTDMLGLSGMNSAPTFLMQAWRGIYVDALSQWVDFPTICAYITKPSRAGDILTIEGQDKGALASFPTTSITIKKGTPGNTAIRNLLEARAGETRFRFDGWETRLPRDFTLDNQTTPLALAQSMAISMGRRLFYDAEGYCTTKVLPTSPAFTFTSGTGGTLTSSVQTGYWDGDLYNRVSLDGPVVAGKKITAVSVLPSTHPLSPAKLRRGNTSVSGFRTFYYSSTTIGTQEEADKWVDSKLQSLVLQQQTAAFSSVPIWHLQEYDIVRAVDPIDGTDATARWTQATIPMTCEGDQSNGFTRRSGVGFTPNRRPAPVRLTPGKTQVIDATRRKSTGTTTQARAAT